MKVTVKKLDDLKRELKFEVPKDRVAEKLEEVFQEIGKVAKVKGFRPGKAPRHVLEKEHGAYAREETVKKIIPEVYQEGIVQEQIDPIDLPQIEDVDFKDGKVTFTAHVDIKPEIKIKNYKGISVKRKSSEVTEDDINKTLEYFKQSQGKDKEVPIDDELAKGLGYPSLEEFKKALSSQIELDKDRQNRHDIENQIVEALLKEVKFNVPQSLVQKQLERRIHDARHHFKQQGLPENEIDKKEEDLRKNLKASVERDVKVYLILDKIAELENIQVGQGENLPARVIEFLLKEANWQK